MKKEVAKTIPMIAKNKYGGVSKIIVVVASYLTIVHSNKYKVPFFLLSAYCSAVLST